VVEAPFKYISCRSVVLVRSWSTPAMCVLHCTVYTVHSPACHPPLYSTACYREKETETLVLSTCCQQRGATTTHCVQNWFCTDSQPCTQWWGIHFSLQPASSGATPHPLHTATASITASITAKHCSCLVLFSTLLVFLLATLFSFLLCFLACINN